jgi:hypothetical protein
MVTIKGTWSRTNTARWEVYQYRRALRRRMERLGGRLDFTLPQSQKDEEGEGGVHPGPKSGTFTAVVPLRNNWKGSAQNGKVALHLLEAIIDLETCRGAKLKLDRYATETHQDDTVEGLL